METMEAHVNHDDDQATATENIKSLFESAKIYGKTSLDLLKLKAADKSAETVSSVISIVIVTVVMILFFMILNVGIALLLGEVLGKNYYGFFALAGFYFIVGLILNSMKKKWFKIPIANMIVKNIFK